MYIMKTTHVLLLCILLIGFSGCLNAEHDLSGYMENAAVSTRNVAFVTEVVDGGHDYNSWWGILDRR